MSFGVEAISHQSRRKFRRNRDDNPLSEVRFVEAPDSAWSRVESPEPVHGRGVSLLPTLHRGDRTGDPDSTVFLEPSNTSQGPSKHIANSELQLKTFGQMNSVQNLTPKTALI